jgi:hypothetical protein
VDPSQQLDVVFPCVLKCLVPQAYFLFATPFGCGIDRIHYPIIELTLSSVTRWNQGNWAAGCCPIRLLGHWASIVILGHQLSYATAVILDAIKGISTTCQISVICAGTSAVEGDFRADPQIERRFEVTRFAAWTADVAFRRFLDTYERARPLRLASRLSALPMMRALLDEASGITHRIIQRLNAAAILAVHEGIERISPELLAVQRFSPQNVRRHGKATSTQIVCEAPPLLAQSNRAQR